MITFNSLGKYGKLGNQLFQIATVYSHAKKFGFDYLFPDWKYNHYLANPIPIGNIPTNLNDHRERDPFSYTEIPKRDNINLIGYFQNENYFIGIEEEIRNIFSPNEMVVDSIMKSGLDFNGLTAIHVRRGDYLNFPLYHPIPPFEYYEKTIEMLRPITNNFLVFSDDIDWCKSNFSSDFLYSEEKEEFVDLIKMSMCSNFITANSSYSWWGSFLSKNKEKVIYAPDNWVGRGYAGTGWRQVYRKEMKIV